MRTSRCARDQPVERVRQGADEMPIVADTGDALFASVDIRANQCIAPA